MDNLQHAATQGESEKAHFGTIQHDLSHIKPTAAEISHLWSSYLAESMSVAFLKHMVRQSKDPDFHDVLQYSLDISSQRILLMEELFSSIQHPVPKGFGEEDVNSNASELYDDAFSVRYTRAGTKYILLNYGVSYSDSSRIDFRNLFSGFMNTSKDVIERANEVLLTKGLFSKSPYLPTPDRVEFVKDKSYYGSFFGGHQRPLNAIEVSNIFSIMDYKMAIRTLTLGFAQITKSGNIKDYLNRGLKIADKQLQVLGALLEKDSLKGPDIVNYQVTDSKESPYSDRLMIFHFTVAIAYIVTAYGLGLTNSARKDVVLTFSRLMVEILEFVKDGADILIENGWLERVPEAPNRQVLTH